MNNIVNNIVEEHNGKLQFEKIHTKGLKKKISGQEQGLRWLIKESKESNIAVVKADKGSAILRVEPSLLETAVLKKLEDTSLYTCLEEDPTDQLSDELYSLWLTGKMEKFVTPEEAYKVMGITSDNHKSTSSQF